MVWVRGRFREGVARCKMMHLTAQTVQRNSPRCLRIPYWREKGRSAMPAGCRPRQRHKKWLVILLRVEK